MTLEYYTGNLRGRRREREGGGEGGGVSDTNEHALTCLHQVCCITAQCSIILYMLVCVLSLYVHVGLPMYVACAGGYHYEE